MTVTGCRLAHTVAVVTGAGVGIGRAVVERLAEEGAHVVATSRSAGNVDDTVARVRAAGGSAEAVVLDVSDRAAIERVVAGLVERHGSIGVLVANAGIELPHGPSVEDTTDDDWDRVFEVNVGGVFRVVRAVLPSMADGGSVITVGSINSIIAWPNDAAYTASKGAVLQFTRALALEAAPRGIRANCVCPGVIDTPLIRSFLDGPDAGRLAADYAAISPLGRMGTPREVADAVLFLASDESTFVTGSALLVDGGTTAR